MNGGIDHRLRKRQAFWGAEVCGIQPGTPEYRRLARALMPLEVVVGRDQESGEEVQWTPGAESNGFLLVTGASGSGKTEALRTIGAQIVQHGIPVLVLDFHGDVNFQGLSTVSLSSGIVANWGINPLELDGFDPAAVGLAEQRECFLELVRRLVGLGHRQMDLLRQVLTQAYHFAGIQDAMPATWRRPPPTLASVLSQLRGYAAGGDTATKRNLAESCLSVISAIFGHPLFGRPQCISADQLLAGNVRLDFSSLVIDGVRKIAADTLLRKLFRALRLRGPVPGDADDLERFRLFILIDEAKILTGMQGDVDDMNGILNLLATEGRKFGIGLILASQSIDHFGVDVRGNVGALLAMKSMDERDARRTAQNVRVSARDLMDLKGRGDGYFVSGWERMARRLQVSSVDSWGEEEVDEA